MLNVAEEERQYYESEATYARDREKVLGDYQRAIDLRIQAGHLNKAKWEEALKFVTNFGSR
jgi:hypothetical protein